MTNSGPSVKDVLDALASKLAPQPSQSPIRRSTPLPPMPFPKPENVVFGDEITFAAPAQDGLTDEQRYLLSSDLSLDDLTWLFRDAVKKLPMGEWFTTEERTTRVPAGIKFGKGLHRSYTERLWHEGHREWKRSGRTGMTLWHFRSEEHDGKHKYSRALHDDIFLESDGWLHVPAGNSWSTEAKAGLQAYVLGILRTDIERILVHANAKEAQRSASAADLLAETAKAFNNDRGISH